MADDMGAECLGVNGSLSYQTPVLDSLANNGIRFTHCHSQPLCTPSRIKIMTGKYNYRNYIDFAYLDRREPTFGNLMKDAGYKTLVSGKWQLSGAKNKVEGYQDMNRPQHFGFDEYCLWHMTRKGPRFAHPLIEQNGKVLDTSPDDYGPDIVSNYILDFIARNQEEPFFIYYPMLLVHSPFVPTPDSPEWQNPDLRSKKDTRFFTDMVAYTDKIVGKIMAQLAELNLDEHTLVLFVGDNGTGRPITTQTIQGAYPGGKGNMKDNGTHVPMVAYYPAGKQQGVIEQGLIEFSDFVPTLAELAGVNSPVSDGKSFYPALTPDPYTPRSHIFIHYDPYPQQVNAKDGRFVRTIDYKLYHDGRFFDMGKDKWEKQPLNVAELSHEQQGVYTMLKQEMEKAPVYDFSVPHEVVIQ